MIVLRYSESYSDETKCIDVKIYPFSCNKNTIKRIAFKNVYKSTITFQIFYLPTFLQNLRLMRPLSKLGNQIQRVFNSALQACYAERRRLFLFFLLTYIHFEGAHDSQGHTLCPGIRWGWGGGWSRQVLFPLQFFVCFALLDFPILLPFLREKHGFLIACP